MRRFFRKYFRKDNLRFVIKLISPMIGYLISNISLVIICVQSNMILAIGLSILCAICAITVLGVVFSKYQYYRGLATHLQRKNHQLFITCSYISKTNQYRRNRQFNNFTIDKMNIIYDVGAHGVFRAPEEEDIDFDVTYEINNAINNGGDCAKIYHFSLARNNDSNIEAKYRIGKNNLTNMQTDIALLNDKNIRLWYGITESSPIRHGEDFNYSIMLSYKKSFHLLGDNCFLIDPQNYGRNIREINIIIRSKGEELAKLIQKPLITTYYNGMNTNELDGQVCFKIEHNDEYKSYYTHTVHPNTDDLTYIVEISRAKQNNREN